MDEVLRDFLTESAEGLLQLDQELIELERHPQDVRIVHSIFRTVHTIKGTCGFIGLPRLERLTHAMESVLGALREGRLSVVPWMISDILRSVDTIKEILAALEATQEEPAGSDAVLLAALGAWRGLGLVPETSLAAPTPPEARASLDATTAPDVLGSWDRATAGGPALADMHPGSVEAAAPAAPAAAARGSLTDNSLRVGVTVLDTLMNLVGELQLVRNQLIQLVAVEDDSIYAPSVQHLDRVATDLQEAVMKTRMQAMGDAWTKLPRLVRDLALASGKEIALELHGAETELDRQILQAIQDPLTHMVRNAADHGIESPMVRRQAGKAGQGTIRLTAYHENGHVILEVADDGAGLRVETLRRTAVACRLVTAVAAPALTDAQVHRFIFEPGFSTTEKLTNVSGRGVGMDVVRSNVEKIGGTVEVGSCEGRGTTVRIKIPHAGHQLRAAGWGGVQSLRHPAARGR